jgi:hypothetical protein
VAAISDEVRFYHVDPGSFRDRDNAVFLHEGQVFRALSPVARVHWNALKKSAFFTRNIQSSAIIPTEELAVSLQGPSDYGREWPVTLHHEKIPFISYVYEWSSGMLRDAALLQLDLLEQAIVEGFILTDGTPYNVQFRGSEPVYIDVGSFRTFDQKRLWPGYQQFLQLQLYPLMLACLKGISYHPWLRGNLEGIKSSEMHAIFSSLRDLFLPGVFKHVRLAHWAGSAQNAGRADGTATLSPGDARKLILLNTRKLKEVVSQLEYHVGTTAWSDYGPRNHYATPELEHKQRIVESVSHSKRWKLVWDLGANDGVFSRIAAESADYVLALEGDHATVEQTYRVLRKNNIQNILPLYMDLASISSGNGWEGRERAALFERGKPDLVLCLALIHHMVIGANILLDRYVGWLASLQADVVLEFPTRDDVKVKELLASRDDVFYDYSLEHLEQLLGEKFTVASRIQISQTRIMYVLSPL